MIGTNIRLGRLRDGQHEHRPGQVEQLAVPPALRSARACRTHWRLGDSPGTAVPRSRTVIGERSAAMGYTLGQAATAAGKSKTTILRAIQKSKIYAAKDVHGNWSNDPDELHRVYPAVTEGNGGADDHATTGNGDLRARGAAPRGPARGAAPGSRRVARPGAASGARAPRFPPCALAPPVRLSRCRLAGRSTTKAARMPLSEGARDPKSAGTVPPYPRGSRAPWSCGSRPCRLSDGLA